MAEDATNPDGTPTQDNGGEPNGSTPGDTGDSPSPKETELAAEIESLKTKLSETEKRFSGSTKSWQQEKARADKIESELAQFNKYKEHIDFSALDEVIGGENPTQPAKPAAIDPNVQNTINQLQVGVLETNFALNNPDKAFVIKDSTLKKIAETHSVEIMQKEIAEYGRVISKPEDILAKGVDETIALANKYREEGAKAATEMKEKIDGNATDVGGGAGKKKTDEEDEENEPMSTTEFVNMFETQRERGRNPIKPEKK